MKWNNSVYLMIVMIISLLSGCTPASNSASQKQQSEGKAVQLKTTINAKEHLFTVTELHKPVTLQKTRDTKGNYTTPQELLQTHLSAMQRGDYALFLQSWDIVSRDDLTARNKQEKLTDEDWKKRWAPLQKSVFELTHTIEYKTSKRSYTLLAYRGEIQFPVKSLPLHVVATYRDGNRWYLTNELTHDPGYMKIDELLVEKK